jgi:lipoprotein-anchoring transpeptidase ErfK/SrfK
MSAHRKQTSPRLRPRLRRIAAASTSMLITSVALLGAVGVIPLGGAGSAAAGDVARPVSDVGAPHGPQVSAGSTPGPATSTTARTSTALPDGSGSGKRVVFSKSAQRVWLVSADGSPLSTYLVSGSVTDNLRPGQYHVYSRSRWAVGVDDSGVMQYFVRFAHGPQAAIGFHSIPRKHGHPLQTLSQLGTPRSHGCIRQKLSDAERMWGFAKDGTAVVVVA